MFAARSIMFGADDVGVADDLGVGVARVIFPVQCCLRGGWVGVLLGFCVDAAIMASNRFTSEAMLLNISRFSRAASS